MSYPDLQHEIAQRVEPPGFDEVLGRAAAARRRRRTTIGAGIAAGVVVVGGLAVATDLARPDARFDPARPGPTQPWDGTPEVARGLPSDVHDILASERIHHWGIAGSDGATAAVLGTCDDPDECRFVVAARDRDVTTGIPLSGLASLFPVPGGWTLEDETGVRRVTTDGDVGSLVMADVAEGVAGADTVVPTRDGVRLLREDRLLKVPRHPGGVTAGAYVTSSGRLVVVGSRKGQRPLVSVTDDGTSWESSPVGSSTPDQVAARIAGQDDHVAVVVLGDGDDGSIGLLAVQLSHDAGAGWLMARGLGLGTPDAPRNPSSFAVSATGSVFLTTESHGLIRIDPEGFAEAMPRSSHDTSVFTDGDRVCLVAEAGRVDQLECSTDDGRTWQAEPLPGFE